MRNTRQKLVTLVTQAMSVPDSFKVGDYKNGLDISIWTLSPLRQTFSASSLSSDAGDCMESGKKTIALLRDRPCRDLLFGIAYRRL